MNRLYPHHIVPHYLVDDYRIRLMACLALVLFLVLAAVRLWPVTDDAADTRRVYRVAEREAIDIDEIQPTRQVESAPAPPAPPIPIVVPDDEVLGEADLDFSDGLLRVDEPGEDLSASEGNAETSELATSGVTVGPRTVRFVEPEYTREARRRRVRAELVVRVLVSEEGQVEESTIVERFLLDEEGATKTPVDVLGYGLEEAALSAAERWMFRPARKNGKPVASHTVLTFTFGIDT